jgi:hypothetical protein
MDSHTGEKVQKSDGESTVILDEIIRVEGNNPNVKRLWNYNIGNHVELICASIEENGQALDLILYWHVLNPFDTDDLRTLVHAVDVDGNIVAQADAPPLNGKYPTSHWTNGQIIEDHYALPNDETIHSVLIGLYTLDGVRLNVTENGNPMTNNTIELTRETQECKNNE